MKIFIGYSEVHQYVHEHYGKEITLQYVDARTVKVGTSVSVASSNNKQNVLLKLKSLFKKAVSQVVNFVTIDLVVEQTIGNNITIRHGGGIGTEIIVDGVRKYLKKALPEYENILEELSSGVLMVHLDGIPEMKRMCEIITIDGISFEADNIVVVAALHNANGGF